MAKRTAKQVYKSRAWKAVRRYVLERDGYQCQIQGDLCEGRASGVDHITRYSEGGAPFDPANLRAACVKCNSQREGGFGKHRYGPRYPGPSRQW